MIVEDLLRPFIFHEPIMTVNAADGATSTDIGGQTAIRFYYNPANLDQWFELAIVDNVDGYMPFESILSEYIRTREIATFYIKENRLNVLLNIFDSQSPEETVGDIV